MTLRRGIRRAVPVGVFVVALVATACGTDSPVGESSNTTIPVATTAAAESIAPPDTATTAATTTATEPEPDPRTIAGDLGQVVVRLDPLVTLDAPIDSVNSPIGELWIALRAGTIVAIDPASGITGDTVLDISAETTTDGERGLLGLAATDDHLFINFTDRDGHTNVDAFAFDATGRLDIGSRRHLLLIEQPFSNHNGGGLAIGPDGLLYIGVGDGGAANDPLGAGQDPTRLLGSILRIEPTPQADEPYAIPADNPFADGVDGRPEVFITGARNPWRIAFDEFTDDLWVADVGQNQWEEIDLMLGANGWGLGANLGWNLREGTHEFAGERPENNVDPVFEYPHSGSTPSGCSISGGRIYRGLAIPDLVGSYVFGDFCGSTVWAISIADGRVEFRDLGGSVEQLVGITVDPDGELLTLSLTGDVSRIVPA